MNGTQVFAFTVFFLLTGPGGEGRVNREGLALALPQPLVCAAELWLFFFSGVLYFWVFFIFMRAEVLPKNRTRIVLKTKEEQGCP